MDRPHLAPAMQVEPELELRSGLIANAIEPVTEGCRQSATCIKKKKRRLIHVHENVHEEEHEEFLEACREFFLEKIRARSNDVDVSIANVVRVKSYAPKVWHIVVDLAFDFR